MPGGGGALAKMDIASLLHQKRLTIFLFVSSFSLLTGGFLLLVSTGTSKVRVDEIRISGNRYLLRDEIQEMTGLYPGMTISGEDLSRARSILMTQPVVLDASVQRSGKIVTMGVTERQCAAIIRSDDRMVDVDQGLMVLSTNSIRCSGVPVITGRFEIKPDRVENRRLEQLFAVWPIMVKEYPGLIDRLSEIRMNRGGGLTLFLTGNRVRIELGDVPSPEEIRRVVASISYIESEKREAGILDLRGPDAVYIPDI